MRENRRLRDCKSNSRRERSIEVELAGQPMRLVTCPGFPDWEHTRHAVQLIADHAQILPGESVLICPCGHGALGVWAATQGMASHITLLDTNIVAVEAARCTLAANGCLSVQVEAGLPAIARSRYDVLLMVLPKGRDLARLFFLYGFEALREGGRLYLAGPNDAGIKSAIADCASLFGTADLLAYKGGNRVVLFKRGANFGNDLPPSYQMPGLREGTYYTFDVEFRGESYCVCTRPGVFAWRGLDAGTRLLLDAIHVYSTDHVLDVGCGYGIIGMIAAKSARQGTVTLVDADTIACESARATLARNRIENAEVLLGDGLAAVAGRRFTLILSNPPFHSGHAVDYQIAEAFVCGSHDALEPRGRLILVTNRFIPLSRLLTQYFGSVTTLAQTPQYHVLCAEKRVQRSARNRSRQTRN